MEEDDLTYEALVGTLRKLGLRPTLRANVLAHVASDAAANVVGGAHALLDALLAVVDTLVMPAFTGQTMVVPEYGPPDNGIEYGQASERNAQVSTFHFELPPHPENLMAEVLRVNYGALRSVHPALSFVAQGRWSYDVLDTQSIEDPYGPIEWLEANNGYVLLLGENQRANFALHLAEWRAGRQGFVRWAATEDDVLELPNFPGCSDGFEAIAPHVGAITQRQPIGDATAQLIPLPEMLAIAEELVLDNPNALLCQRATCERCRAREPHSGA